MAFFQSSVLNKYLQAQNHFEIKEAFQRYSLYFHNPQRQQNIRDAKEEQFQEGFLRELFVNILGYTLNPNPDFNLTTELKNEKGAKKADGAILKDGKALAIIELKGTDTTDLERINAQAFNYKNNHSNCVYVITSNFEKLRFFVHNSVNHIEFALFHLNEDQFRLLWLCLHSDNLLKGIPVKIKEESLLVDEKITNQLYKDYANFRTELWHNMVKNSSDADQLLLFKKTQKLLDRFLFILFAEDGGLLPPNSISRIVQRWNILKQEDAYKPLYEIFKQYFGYINTGRPGKTNSDDIFAYNGGLFLPDEVLDRVVIDDEVIHKHVNTLTKYNFQSEVDVNILGHIFENSLNEIETITAQLEGQVVDKSKSKRKKDGVFYTPKYITKYIVDSTLGKLCAEKKATLGIVDEDFAKERKKRKKDTIKRLDEQLKAYRSWLLEISICDPACGSGAFLNQALEFLMEEHAYIDELHTKLFGSSIVFQDISNHILEKNLFGVDINEESVEIAKLSLWLRTAQKRRKLTTLNNNLKCGNSLIDDHEVAGEKAFIWQEEFPTVFRKKEKAIFHITTATHDSRTSQRMVDYHVREKRDNGLRPKAEPIWLEPEDELLITQVIGEVVKEDALNVLAYNICGDHIHLILVCEENEVQGIMQKIKAISAKEYNRSVGKTKAAPKAREHAPLSSTNNAPLSEKKEPHISLWTQKFGCTEIESDEQLSNTIEYVQTNRLKHGLPEYINVSKEACSLVCNYDHAFRTEYAGGFDVVIGNPPYVRQELLADYKPFFEKNYAVFEGTSDLFAYFYEKGFSILKKKGLFGFISNTFDKTKAASKLRDYLTSNTQFLHCISFSHEGALKLISILLF